MSNDSNQNHFYVYKYTNPLKNDEEFYIGISGKENRLMDHLNEAKRIINKNKSNKWIQKNCENPHKTFTILKILKSGTTPYISKVLENVTEEQAIDKEIEQIAYYGRRDLGKGPLCNLTDGGEGTSGSIRKKLNLLDKTFNRWTVIEYAGITKNKTSQWLCRCECGTQRIVSGNNLNMNTSKSCGCLKIESAIITHTTFITINGETKSKKEWSEISGTNYSTIVNRIHRGWSPEDAVFRETFK